tara:strand:- start:711 stop:1124 length:414 start_codon:yes stop_codon:yes gene_type:complete
LEYNITIRGGRMNPYHIVVIDDEKAMEMLFNAFFDKELSRGEIKITYLEEPSNFFDILAEEDVRLVMSDINMPIMNGYDFLDKIQEQKPDIPVYMISAYGGKDHIERAMQKGATGFFVKPFDFDVIKTQIREQMKSA